VWSVISLCVHFSGLLCAKLTRSVCEIMETGTGELFAALFYVVS